MYDFRGIDVTLCVCNECVEAAHRNLPKSLRIYDYEVFPESSWVMLCRRRPLLALNDIPHCLQRNIAVADLLCLFICTRIFVWTVNSAPQMWHVGSE